MRLLETLGLKQRSAPVLSKESTIDISSAWSPDGFGDNPEAIEAAISKGGPAFWDGAPLKHVYRKQGAYGTDSCPKCQHPLVNFYVGLVYGSRRELRQHMSPCAFVCDPCSVVVLDEKWPREMAMEKGYQYTVPVGIYSLRRPPPPSDKLDFFQTYEGREVVYVLDEDGFLEDIMYKDGGGFGFKGGPNRQLDAQRRKAKRKAEKAARKRNRRH